MDGWIDGQVAVWINKRKKTKEWNDGRMDRMCKGMKEWINVWI